MPGPAATVGSMHICPMCNPGTPPPPHIGGPVSGPGVPTVLIGGKPAAVMGDMCICAGPPDAIVQGEGTVLIGGKPAATIGSMTAHGGSVTAGEATVLIGTGGSAKTAVMPVHKIPFPEIPFTLKVMASITGNGKQLNEAIAQQNVIREQAPVEEVPEDSTTVTLSTTFAKDQLIYLCQHQPKALFMAVFIKIFGDDIPTQAFEELYEDIQNEAPILEMPLTVKKEIPFGGRQAAFYSDHQKDIQEIFVAEQVIKDAVIEGEEGNELRGELMTMLIEEYGHYLDYLLRHKYALTENKDAQHDEGAKFAYKLYTINPVEQTNQLFANATIDGTAIDLIWDFTETHNNLKQYVNEERQNQDDNVGNYEFYKAGSLNPSHGDYGHADIEKEALEKLISRHLKETILDDKIIVRKTQKYLDKIYLGNWLRDFSQAADPMVVRPMANALDKGTKALDENKAPSDGASDPNKITELDLESQIKNPNFQHVKTSVDFIASGIEMSAAKESINKPDKKGNATKYKDTDDFGVILDKFHTEFMEIDIDTLGVYRPEEHIDNPKGLGHTKQGSNRGDKELYDKFTGFVSNNSPLHTINTSFGMKNYIRANSSSFTTGGGSSVKTAHAYIISKLEAAAKGAINETKSLADLGAALHTLEDYFAHTNYAEVSLMKTIQPAVFPWVDHVKETGFKYVYDNVLNGKQPNESELLFPLNKLKNANGNPVNRIAACIPIVTGTFGMVDTASSVMPIINEHLFGIEIKPWVKSKPGERTFADIMVLKMAKDYDANETGKIINYESAVKSAYKFRDYMVKAKDLILHDKIEEGLHYVFQYISMLFSFMQYFTTGAIVSSLNDAQLAINKDLDIMEGGAFSIGVDPSHTQVAKDDTHHPLHNLSAKLAVYAVKHIGGAILDGWKSGDKTAKKAIDLLNICMQHPAVSDWQDGIVESWAKENPQKVCDACSPSIIVERVMHAIEHVNDGIKAADNLVNNTQVIDKLANYFNTNEEKRIDVDSLKNNIKKVILNGTKLTERATEIQIIWDKKYPKPDNCIILDEEDTKLHLIKPNETLTSIAAIYHTDVATLKALNKTTIIGQDTIHAHSYLKVPTNPKKNETDNHHDHQYMLTCSL